MSAVAASPEATSEEQQQEQPSNLTQLPLFEGHRVIEARMNFGGNIAITDADLAKTLKLGAEVEFVIRGRVVSRGHKSKGDERQAVSSANVVVDEILPVAE